jgi:LEA14-like dessication related protein
MLESIIEVQIKEALKVSLKFRSKKLRKHHRSSDRRSSESIIEVQIKEAQKAS